MRLANMLMGLGASGLAGGLSSFETIKTKNNPHAISSWTTRHSSGTRQRRRRQLERRTRGGRK